RRSGELWGQGWGQGWRDLPTPTIPRRAQTTRIPRVLCFRAPTLARPLAVPIGRLSKPSKPNFVEIFVGLAGRRLSSATSAPREAAGGPVEAPAGPVAGISTLRRPEIRLGASR